MLNASSKFKFVIAVFIVIKLTMYPVYRVVRKKFELYVELKIRIFYE